MITAPRLSHVVFMTRRFEEMLGWYAAVFNTSVVHQDPALAFVTYDDEPHRFAFANLEVLKPGGDGRRGDIGVNHVAFTYGSARDLLETYARLKSIGIEPYWPVHHGMTLSLYYRDPDGNRLELQVDALPAAQAMDYMTGPIFGANPVGFAIDPEALLAAQRAGAGETELLRLPDSAPSEIPAEHGLMAPAQA